jgi:hypothetical protein
LLNATLKYGDGSDFVSGDIGVGKFSIGQYTIPFQGASNVPRHGLLLIFSVGLSFLERRRCMFQFLHPTPTCLLTLASKASEEEDPDFNDGIFGLWGLGFNTPGSSGVNDAVQEAYGANANWGQSVLANIFDQNPNGADYIGISLSRTGDQEGTADASLTISEYDSDYQAVANSPKIPQTPVNSGAWTVTLDGLSVGGKKIDWPSTMEVAPAGKNIVHLDTGYISLFFLYASFDPFYYSTTNILMPADQLAVRQLPDPDLSKKTDEMHRPFIPLSLVQCCRRTRIFPKCVPVRFYYSLGSHQLQTKFSTTDDVWVVPCNASVNVVATFG